MGLPSYGQAMACHGQWWWHGHWPRRGLWHWPGHATYFCICKLFHGGFLLKAMEPEQNGNVQLQQSKDHASYSLHNIYRQLLTFPISWVTNCRGAPSRYLTTLLVPGLSEYIMVSNITHCTLCNCRILQISRLWLSGLSEALYNQMCCRSVDGPNST